MGEALAEVAGLILPAGTNGKVGGQMLPARRWQHSWSKSDPGSNRGKASARFGYYISLHMNKE
jgi:hypothetical protein